MLTDTEDLSPTMLGQYSQDLKATPALLKLLGKQPTPSNNQTDMENTTDAASPTSSPPTNTTPRPPATEPDPVRVTPPPPHSPQLRTTIVAGAYTHTQ